MEKSTSVSFVGKGLIVTSFYGYAATCLLYSASGRALMLELIFITGVVVT
jgi:hypothetical protein